MVNQCSIGPRPGRARQIDCSSIAGAEFEKRNTNLPLCGSKTPPSYCHFVASKDPCCVTEGSRASGTGASSHSEAPFAEPSCVTTGTPCCTVTVKAVSSVDKLQDLSPSEHQARSQQVTIHAITISKRFIWKCLPRLYRNVVLRCSHCRPEKAR